MHFLPIGPTSDRESAMTATPSMQEYQEFYTVYGECFSAWSDVESHLLAVFIFLLRSPDYSAASAVFYSTVGFRAKLSMVDEVVTNSKSVHTDNLTEWKSINSEASKKSRRRNELAHNTVFYGRLNGIGSRKMFVGDPRTPSEASRLHTHDLGEVRDSFYSLGKRVFGFWQRLQN